MKYAALALMLSFSLASAHAQNSPVAEQAAQAHRASKASDKPATANAASAKSVGSSQSLAGRLKACKQQAGWNPIERETCVWSLCKARWGRDGCPAKATPNGRER